MGSSGSATSVRTGSAGSDGVGVGASGSGSGASVFTAPDGRVFDNRVDYRRYLADKFYSFTKRTGETLTKVPGEVKGQPFNLADLTDCTVRVCDHCDMVQMDRLTGCRVFIAASSESVFLRNCRDCVFYIACKQLRTRDCVDCEVHLYAKTDPIVEKSHRMAFAPFDAACPRLDSLFASASLPVSVNHWSRVYDFSADDTTMPTPHWTVTRSPVRPAWTISDLPGFEAEAPVNPVPADTAPLPLPTPAPTTGSADAAGTGTGVGLGLGAMLSFDIRTTSQQAAQAALAAQTEALLAQAEAEGEADEEGVGEEGNDCDAAAAGASGSC